LLDNGAVAAAARGTATLLFDRDSTTTLLTQLRQAT
jgi:hypothetical protein